MSTKRAEIRQLLRSHEDGLTVKQIAELISVEPSNATAMVQKMPDAYIDRWVKPRRGPFTAVWCVVDVPAHCPRPTKPARAAH